MVKIVTEGAIMCCTLGTWQAKLTVLSQSFRSISGALVATEEDKTGLNNIPGFGICKCSSPPPPCKKPIQIKKAKNVMESILILHGK